MVQYKTIRLPVKSYGRALYPQTSVMYRFTHQRSQGPCPRCQSRDPAARSPRGTAGRGAGAWWQGPGPALTAAPATASAAAHGGQQGWVTLEPSECCGGCAVPTERQLGAAHRFRIQYKSSEASRL